MDDQNIPKIDRKKATFDPVDKPDIWEKQLLLSCIPLRCYSETGEEVDRGSGCLIDYLGHRFILSVSHTTLKAGEWVIFEDTRLFRLPPLSFLGRVPIKDVARILRDGAFEELSKDIVDFSYGIVPKNLQPIHEHFNENGQPLWKAPRTIFKTELDHLPEKGLRYGFSGHSNFARYPHLTDPNSEVICCEHVIHGDLVYLRTEDDLHYFKLPGEHPGHGYFKGCSGAPIINEKGELVALVKGGNSEDDTIHGVSLRTYRGAVKLAVNSV